MRPSAYEPDYDDPSSVYAFFGLTYFKACVLEQGAVNLVVALRAKADPDVHQKVVSDLFVSHDSTKATFGTVLKEARKRIQIDPTLDADLAKALDYRNYLAHSFFLEHDRTITTPDGRKTMIDELIEIIKFFNDVDPRLDVVWKDAWETLGFTQEWIDAEVAQLLADQQSSRP